MTKWELARYLIDAKKNVDTIWYIEQNSRLLLYLNLRNRVRSVLNEFYINCAIVLDNSKVGKKKDLCNLYHDIERIYYERDKNAAHKDENYQKQHDDILEHILNNMKQQLLTVRQVCQSALPENITLDFIPFDSELFRIAHGVNPDKERKIMEDKHRLPQNQLLKEQSQSLKLIPFNDAEEIRNISSDQTNKYGVIIKNGINCEEGLQNRQDAAIKINVLFGYDIWVTFSEDEWRKQQHYRKIGLFDQFDTLLFPENEVEQKAFVQKLKDEELIDG